MDAQMKLALFRAGRYELTEAPTTATWHWDEKDWINWIDQHGRWDPANQPNEKMAFGYRWVRDPHTGKHRLKLSA